jgi:tetratricopeptide (TPR) repeat protein
VPKAFRIAFALTSAAFSSAVHAEWRRYETAHFIIYSEAGDKKATKRATELEKIDGLMRLATGLSSDVQPVKVRIYELGNEGDVQAAFGGGPEGLAGFYSSNVLGPYAVTERSVVMGQGVFNADLVLHHEYAHHFMLQYFPAEYPAWYSEGFAELIGATKMLDDGRVGYGFPAKYRGDYLAVEWVPVDEVVARPPDKVPPYDVYGQGWAMTHFFTFNKARTPQLTQYLRALTAGGSRADAAKVFGDLAVLNREAHDYISRGVFEYKPVKVPIQDPVVQSITPVGAAEAALIPEIAAFKDYDVRSLKKESDRQQEIRRRAGILDRIRSKTARYPNDPYALYFLAEAENVSGSKAAAEAAVDRLLAVQPNNVRGLVRKSMLLSDSAGKLSGQARTDRAVQARALAMRANQIDTNEPLTYVAFYQGYRSAGLKPSLTAVQGLEAAVDKLPADETVRRMLVEEYADEHRWRAAIETLGPLANNSHDSPLRAEARERLAQLQAKLKSEAGISAATK